MKTITKLCYFCTFASAISLAAQPMERPKAAVTYQIDDERKEPVPKASVRIGFMRQNIAVNPGDEQLAVTGNSDITGRFVAEGHSDGHIPADVSKEGYYPSFAKPLEFKFSEVRDSRWQPWNPTVDVLLKKIVNPVPMYARKVQATLPKFDKPVGFDLEAADWVAPHGQGKVADLIFTCTRTVRAEDDFESELKLTFSNPGDGLQSVIASHQYGSALALPREAPEDGYVAEWKHQTALRPGGTYEVVREDQNYFYRVRSVMENSKVIRAWYGKIHGEIQWYVAGDSPGRLQFTYYLNPDATRNMEFDPRRNKFNGLGVTEQVRKP